jgi:peptidoglycan hydrolase CwlO-like protein
MKSNNPYVNNTVEINKSIMELNHRKEKLQNEVDDIQAQINFLASLRESQRMTDDERSGQSLFDQMFGVK